MSRFKTSLLSFLWGIVLMSFPKTNQQKVEVQQSKIYHHPLCIHPRYLRKPRSLQGSCSVSPTGLRRPFETRDQTQRRVSLGPSVGSESSHFFRFPSCLIGVHLCQSHTSSPLYSFDALPLPSWFVPVSLIWGESELSVPQRVNLLWCLRGV